MERPAYSITLDDLGAQVQWRLTLDGETLDEGAAPIRPPAGVAGVMLRQRLLGGAFDLAYLQADQRRQQRFQRDLEVAALAATREQAGARYRAVQFRPHGWPIGAALPWGVRDSEIDDLIHTGGDKPRTWQTSLRQVALDEATRLNNEHERVEQLRSGSWEDK